MSEPTSEDLRREAEQDHTAARADAAERVKIQASIADAAMRAMMLANGGAMVALFTFVGNVMTKGGSAGLFSGAELRSAFACFVGGLVLALAAHVFAFMSQDRFYRQSIEEIRRSQRIQRDGEWEAATRVEEIHNRCGNVAYVAGLVASLISITLFSVGCWFALQGVLIR